MPTLTVEQITFITRLAVLGRREHGWIDWVLIAAEFGRAFGVIYSGRQLRAAYDDQK